MSTEPTAVVRGVYANFGRGDIPAVLDALDPNIEWVEGAQEYLPHRGRHRGPNAVAEKVFGMVQANFDEFAVVPELFHEAGDVVVVEGRVTGKTKTGRRLDAPVCWVWTVRNGKATSNHNYHDTDAWREALSA